MTPVIRTALFLRVAAPRPATSAITSTASASRISSIFGLGPAVIHPALISHHHAASRRLPGGVRPPTRASGRVDGAAAGRAAPRRGLRSPHRRGRAGGGAVHEREGERARRGRYSYTAALFTILQSDTQLSYRDYQIRGTYQLSDHDTISLLGFGAYDYAAQQRDARPVGAPLHGPIARRRTRRST